MHTLVLVAVLLCLLLVYIHFFIFIHGAPNKGTEQDKWIRQVAFGPNGDIWKTTRTWGFFKASFREFCRYYRTLFSLHPQACLGALAPDGDLFTLEGASTSLEEVMYGTAALPLPADMPLVLNIGSYS